MNTVDFSRRVSAKTIDADVDAFHGLSTIRNYIPVRTEATPEALKAGYEAMLARQQQETELQATIKAASDAARQAEVEFHDLVMAMKESVRGQFGPNSDEAQAIGYKKSQNTSAPAVVAPDVARGVAAKKGPGLWAEAEVYCNGQQRPGP